MGLPHAQTALLALRSAFVASYSLWDAAIKPKRQRSYLKVELAEEAESSPRTAAVRVGHSLRDEHGWAPELGPQPPCWSGASDAWHRNVSKEVRVFLFELRSFLALIPPSPPTDRQTLCLALLAAAQRC